MKKVFLFISIFSIFITSTLLDQNIKHAYASQTKSVTLDKGTVTRTMKWQNQRSYRFLTDSWIGKFPKTIEYEKDGYRGTLTGKTMILTPANRQSNRKVTLTGTWTDSTYRVRQSDVPVPSSIKKSYTDTASDTTITQNVPKSGGLVSVRSKSVKVYSASYGRAEYYDPVGNTRLGYMSNNTSTYYGGAYSFSASKPRSPSDYYGPDGGEFGSTGWTLTDIAWDECCVRDAKDSKWHYKTARFGYMWRSDAGNLNRYRKGVYLNYYKYVTGHQYKQNYSGTYSLPDTATKWNVKVVYEGTIYKYNLTATNIDIYDTNNNKVNVLVKGREYKARVTYKNTGEETYYNHWIKLLENSSKLNEILITTNQYGDLRPNESRTVYIPFTAKNRGTRTFKAIVNSKGYQEEFNTKDNEVAVNKLVNSPPIANYSINPNPTDRLTNTKFTNQSTDPDGDDLTYKWQQRKKGTTTWKQFSTAKHPSFKFPEVATYEVRLTATDPYGERNSIVKNVTVKNLPPVADFKTDKTIYYIGDEIKITSLASDPEDDSLTYHYQIKKPNNSIFTNTNKNFSFKSDQVGDYRVTQTVTDPYGASDSMTIVIPINELYITGYVKHTPRWEEKHHLLGNLPNQFYSGETFVLDALVTDYTIDYVKVYFSGIQVNGSILSLTTNLTPVSSILYKGALYDNSMSEPETMLQNGMVPFQFEVKYSNGTVRKDIVEVEMIGSVYSSLKFHRRY